MNILQAAWDVFIPHARNNYVPFAISRKPLSFYAGFMVVLKLLTLVSLDLLPHSEAQASDVNSANILQLTNYSRSVFGLAPLHLNSPLSFAAQAKAEDMLKNQYFGHNSPQGLTPWDFVETQGYNYVIAGENLALNFSSSENVGKAWMNSAGHKANILNRDFQDIGIGIATGMYKGQKTVMVVQIFGTSVSQPYTPKLAYTQPQNLLASQQVAGETQTALPVVPTPQKISLQSPFLENPKFSLTNKKEYQISGFAPDANTVYILVNNKPQVRMEVIQSRFSGTLSLSEGNNTINAVSFNNVSEASNISNEIVIQLDTISPLIDNAQFQPIQQDDQTYYSVAVQATADVAKMIATLDQQSIMLQPSGEANLWVGQFAVDPEANIAGKVIVNAYDLAGNTQPTEVASFSSSLQQTYDPAVAPNQLSKSAGNEIGKRFAYDQFNMIYLYFALFILGVLTLAIGIKRHIQHVGVIAHASAMAAIAIIFWVT